LSRWWLACKQKGFSQPHITIIMFDGASKQHTNPILHTHKRTYQTEQQQQQQRPYLGLFLSAAAMATNKPAGHDSKSFHPSPPPCPLHHTSLPPSLPQLLLTFSFRLKQKKTRPMAAPVASPSPAKPVLPSPLPDATTSGTSLPPSLPSSLPSSLPL
jgi:hypothetical protein